MPQNAPPLVLSSVSVLPPPSCARVACLHAPCSVNRVLPPGTYVPLYVLRRDARNFVFPDAFWPKRWLVMAGHLPLELAPASPALCSDSDVAGARVDFVHNEGAFISFSCGPLSCVGKGFGVLQVRIGVCALMQRFRVRL